MRKVVLSVNEVDEQKTSKECRKLSTMKMIQWRAVGASMCCDVCYNLCTPTKPQWKISETSSGESIDNRLVIKSSAEAPLLNN